MSLGVNFLEINGFAKSNHFKLYDIYRNKIFFVWFGKSCSSLDIKKNVAFIERMAVNPRKAKREMLLDRLGLPNLKAQYGPKLMVLVSPLVWWTPWWPRFEGSLWKLAQWLNDDTRGLPLHLISLKYLISFLCTRTPNKPIAIIIAYIYKRNLNLVGMTTNVFRTAGPSIRCRTRVSLPGSSCSPWLSLVKDTIWNKNENLTILQDEYFEHDLSHVAPQSDKGAWSLFRVFFEPGTNAPQTEG